MKKIFIITLIILIIGFVLVSEVHAESDEITFSMARDFGYSSGSGKIQGLFSMKANSQLPLTEVEFYIDATLIMADKEEPYKVQFNTDDYSLGKHSLYVVGITTTGEKIVSNEVLAYFVSAEESRTATLKIIIPVLGSVFFIVIIAGLIPAITSRKKRKIEPGVARNYGFAGGTICSKCKHPFALHLFAPNMLIGKLERCPNCGRWGIFRSFFMEKLREAENAELEKNEKLENIYGIDDDEKFRKEIDDSRFQEM